MKNIWIGAIDSYGHLKATRFTAEQIEQDEPTHDSLHLRGERFRFNEELNTVYWWGFGIEKDAHFIVENFLLKRGFSNVQHKTMGDFGNQGYCLTHRDCKWKEWEDLEPY